MAAERQLALAFARETGHKAATRAARRADKEIGGWELLALESLRWFCDRATGPFLAEQVRESAEARGLPPAPDGRAWGAVMTRGRSKGWIESCGYAQAVSSNSSPKVLWRVK